MRAIALERFGGADVCVERDMQAPSPAPDELLIEIAFAGVNFIDIYMRNGTYARSSTYKTPLPMTLGMEGSGRVAAVGKPVEIADDVACAAMLQGTTAHYLTSATYALQHGDWCLVHAAAGGAGQLIVQFAKQRGATVIGTVGSAEKAEIARRCGADHVILYQETDVARSVREVTGGRGVDVVYDSADILDAPASRGSPCDSRRSCVAHR